ncbi:MAG TPA: glycosyltransferase family 2 protein [Cellvibrio sp.]|nr:glycosyltransferase family 2 protein [Cellvibrio sp.]
MNSGYWLSILIPVYNVEAYLVACLDSVCSQVDSTIEIIVLDDCSTDNSNAILNTFASQSHIKLTLMQHEKNQGLSAARNSMLDVAQGTYIWFLDSDDVLELGAIQQLSTIVEQHSPDLVLCDFRVLRENQKPKHRLRGENHRASFVGISNCLLSNGEDLFYGLYKKGELHVWSKIAKRTLWGDDLRFPVGRTMEDMVTTPRLAVRARTYYYQPSVWVAYRRRAGSILNTLSEQKIEDAALGCEGVLAVWLKQYPSLSAQARLAFSHYCARTHYVVMRDLKQVKPKDIDQQKSAYRQQFLNNTQWTKLQLCWQYSKRGLISRVIRLLTKY